MLQVHPEPVVTAPPVLNDGARAALADARESSPAGARWLALLEHALTEADRPEWRRARIHFAPARPADAPLLEGARLLVDAAAAARHLDALLGVLDRGPAPDRPDPLGVIEAGAAQDADRLDRMAAAHDLDGAAFATIAHFAAVPVLLEAARRAAPMIPPAWRHGHCPVCGAWPTLAEVRGLDRRRVLRCGRCAAGWDRDVLHCAFCGERNHRRQGSLVPDQEGERTRVETCDSCRGYLKAVTTLGPTPVWKIPLDDFRTLPLDFAATDRGYARPGTARAPAMALAPIPDPG